jgi:flagellar hook-associated protein 1 FlgK
MSNLFDIGKSGLNAYRQSLAVTGQNIANIDTDGYKRREAGLEEVSAGTGSVTGISKQTGVGVRITGIRRSFDEFLLNKARSATASAEAKEALYASIKQLEDILLPGDANLGTSIGQFFSSLQEIVTSPSDLAPRVVALEQGKLLANSFNDVAAVVQQLKDGIVTQSNQEIDSINMLAGELANLNQQISAAGLNKVNNALLDRRDALVDKISESVGVSVRLGSSGTANLTIGDSGRGPVLIEGNEVTPIGIDPEQSSISFVMSPGVANIYTSQVTKGALSGLADSYATVASVMNEIDHLAFKLVQDMNAIHVAGLDMDGMPGKNIFQDIDLNLTPNPTNAGDVMAEVQIHDHSILSADKVTFSFDEVKNIWNGRKDDGTLVASGRHKVDMAGVTITFIGKAENFDQFVVDPLRGTASGVAIALRRPQDFAAASPLLISADASNRSDAQIGAQVSQTTSPTGLPVAGDIFSNDGSIISATQFLTGGPVSVIPAEVTSVDLFSLIQQSSVKFGLGEADLLSASHLSLKITSEDSGGNDVTHEIRFTLDQSNFNEDSNGWRNMNQIADLLNLGSMTGTNVSTGATVKLSELGGYASGANGNLTISLTENRFASAGIDLTTGRTVSAVVTPRTGTASNIQIFTREGRHIAGSVPDNAQITNWQSQMDSNAAFNDGAVYRGDYLNLSGDTGYMGVTVDRAATSSEVLIDTVTSTTQSSITFDSLEGVDTNESSPNGQFASAKTVSYSATIGSLSATVDGDDIAGTAGSDVATAMVKELRKDAPTAYIEGLVSLKTSFSFNLSAVSLTESAIHSAGTTTASYQGATYTFKSDGSNITVSGGPDNAVDLSYSSTGTLISGKLETRPAEGDVVYLSFEGQQYTLTMVDGEVVVGGGEPGRLNAFYDANFKLQVASNDGTVSKSTITVVDDSLIANNKAAAQRFGIMQNDDFPTNFYSNQAWLGIDFKTGGTAAEGNETIQVDLVGSVAGSTDDLTFTTAALSSGDDTEILTAIKTAFDNLGDKKGYSAHTGENGTLWFTRPDGGNFSFEATEGGVVGSTSITLQATPWPSNKVDLTSGVATSATSIGTAYTALDFDLVRNGASIEAKPLNNTSSPGVSGTAKSAVGQRLKITDLPDEELIIIVGNSGARKLSMQYDALPPDGPKLHQDLQVKVIDAATNKVEFIDTTTGTSLATRTLDANGVSRALGFETTLYGVVEDNDVFHIADNGRGIGDATAMIELTSLQNAEGRPDKRGGFQKVFNATVSRLGAMVQTNALAAEAAVALKDASLEAESSFSGVNLDTEAANLIEQQQAYQASARILSTARELFNTLLDSFR